MAAEKIRLRDLCREVGVSHLQVVEVLRRIDSRVRDGNEVITKTVGTFYLRKSKPTTRVLNGVAYEVPAKEAVALRGKRFPGREVGRRINLVGLPGWSGSIVDFIPGGGDPQQELQVQSDLTIPPSFNVMGSTWRVSVAASVLSVGGDPIDEFSYQYSYRAECLDVNSPSQFVNVRPTVHETHTGQLEVFDVYAGHVVESTGVVRHDRFSHTNRLGSVGNQNGAPTRPFQFTLMVDVDETGQRP